MRTAFTVLVGLLAASSAFYFFRSLHKQTPLPKTTVAKFSLWKNQFRKLYATPQEDQYRLSVFASQVDTVDRLNEKYNLYLEKTGQPALQEPMFTLQEDSDLTTEEFTKLKTGLQLPEGETIEIDESPIQEITEPNLSQTSYQHRIRNQGSCGSCWAFSTVATLEKMYYDLNRVQVDLSQQYLVDCATVANGCSGGWPSVVYTWIQTNDIVMNSVYPYQAAVTACKRSQFSAAQFAKLAPKITSKNLGWSLATAIRVSNSGVSSGVVLFASGGFRYVSKNDDIFDPQALGECSNRITYAVNMIAANSNFVTKHNSPA